MAGREKTKRSSRERKRDLSSINIGPERVIIENRVAERTIVR